MTNELAEENEQRVQAEMSEAEAREKAATDALCDSFVAADHVADKTVELAEDAVIRAEALAKEAAIANGNRGAGLDRTV